MSAAWGSRDTHIKWRFHKKSTACSLVLQNKMGHADATKLPYAFWKVAINSWQYQVMAWEIPRLYECNILELLARQRQPTCLASLILKHYTCLDRVGYVKDKVSATKVTGVGRSEDTDQGWHHNNRRMLDHTWEELEFRMDVLCATRSGHTEVHRPWVYKKRHICP
jgi:hypothetical protein